MSGTIDRQGKVLVGDRVTAHGINTQHHRTFTGDVVRLVDKRKARVDIGNSRTVVVDLTRTINHLPGPGTAFNPKEELDPGIDRQKPTPPLDPIKTVSVTVNLSEQAVALVEDLVATGLYGTQREEACERLVCEMLAEKYPKAFKSLGVRLR